MASSKGLRIFLGLILVSLLIEGQVPPTGSKNFFAATEDVPFIRCKVCQKALKHLRKHITSLRETAVNNGKKMDEDDILSVVEKTCAPDSTHGNWISRYDIVESSGSLSIIEKDLESRCRQECKTIAKACEESIGEIDTDLGELLWKDDLSLSKLVNKVCYEMTNACSKKIPKYKPGKRKDELFKGMSEDEKKAYDMMKQMKSAPGMPGMEMYSKEDIAQMQGQHQDKGPSGNEQQQEQARESSQEIPADTQQGTGLGLLDTIKATFSGLSSRFKKLFGFKSKKTEL
eukprot:Seg3634.3 transcript_id=Seg3634.3/GoldUCD/mRNA.D3Y31 product="hypothetical protein" protein_id=Seg3634.3/GoldUCD/D3Y31